MTRPQQLALMVLVSILLCIGVVYFARSLRAEPLMLCKTLVVIDGDTLHCNETRVRLWGIDAPDFTCGARFHCREDKHAAALARDALRGLVSDSEVHCRPIDRDKYGRTVARCYAKGTDIGCTLIRQGHAIESVRFSKGAYQGCKP